MKHVKMLGLAAVAAAALMAFAGAGTASAGGVLCSTTVNPCPAGQRWTTPQSLDFTAEESVKLQTTGGFITAVTCTTARAAGSLTTNPGGTTLATGTNELLTWGTPATPCTKKSTTSALGKSKVEQIAGTSNGTVIADETITVTIEGVFSGESCIYGVTAGTPIGVITEGNPATFDAKAVAEKFADPKKEDNCPAGPITTEWSGKYLLTSPSNTTLSVSSS